MPANRRALSFCGRAGNDRLPSLVLSEKLKMCSTSGTRQMVRLLLRLQGNNSGRKTMTSQAMRMTAIACLLGTAGCVTDKVVVYKESLLDAKAMKQFVGEYNVEK
jgi:hypothetical protein